MPQRGGSHYKAVNWNLNWNVNWQKHNWNFIGTGKNVVQNYNWNITATGVPKKVDTYFSCRC